MKIDAVVLLARAGKKVVVPVDQDYVRPDFDDIEEWVERELERKYARPVTRRDFDVLNIADVCIELDSMLSSAAQQALDAIEEEEEDPRWC